MRVFPLPLIRGIVAMATGCCVSAVPASSPPEAAPVPAIAASAITHITLERDCNGCPHGTVIVLGRDGEARRMLTGKARLGTEDQRFHATLRTADFDALAQRVIAAGLPAMADRYEEADLQDGPWSSIAITLRTPDGGSRVKDVFRRGDAGPPALQALEEAIDAQQRKLQFAPDAR